MDDADGNNAVWTRIKFSIDAAYDGLDELMIDQIEGQPLLASADSREVEVLQEGRCLCGQPLSEETVILSNSGGNLAVMCSGECFDDFMMLGMLQQITDLVGKRIQTRKPDDPD